ncbi:hypothetical protein [Lutibacter sp.]
MFKKFILSIPFLVSAVLLGQNDTSSPYSLYGLGVENKTSFGGFTAMGNSGVGQIEAYQINNLNPANLANIPLKSFLYEVGVNGTYSTIKTSDLSQNTTDFNFSHLAFAFPVIKNWGMSIGLVPYSKVGYDIDIESPIEGSTSTFTTSIIGSGGLSKLYWGNGLKIHKNISLGLELSFLFGTIDQESWVFTNPNVNIIDRNYYNGAKLKTGIHITMPNIANVKTTFGGTIEIPTSLSGTQNRVVYKSNGILVEEDENTLNNFELPLAITIGMSNKINKHLTTNFDYKKLWWENTNQYDNAGTYTNQSIYALGVSYIPSKGYGFSSLIKYRLGINYNTGFLNISDQKIDSYSFSAGVGIPISKLNASSLNISYSIGKEGTISNNLIEENFHKLTLNLSLVGKWFQKQKIF